ncbi:MAG TPA: DEAD/DEAH box helicase [Candidatus Limnocylindrales bacterium]|nr:DEAD/DEAH box helicase [Candidatus Limnocylindrales bacterium]
MSFDELGLAPELLRAVADQGYTEPTPVQRESIPLVLAGRDLLAGAQTGTGKTAAFVLPMLQRLNAERTPGWKARPTDGRAPSAQRPPFDPVRALILTPTRELCLQVEESVRTYGRHRRIRSVAIYGGVGYEPQNRALRAGPGIVVATPGRLLDHIDQRHVDLSRVEILVLDEADRMLDMGFIRDIRKVLDLLPTERQTLLFSATFSDEIRRLAAGILRDPATVQVTPRNTATELVTQVVHPVDRGRKRDLLSHLIRSGRIEQALVFTRTKHGANRLAEQLAHDGIAAAAIHGNKSQGQRVRALGDFKTGRAAILVATEVASRGLDIEDLPHVVNFELPLVAEDYVHRIGRTGRAGASGDAISLVCVDEAPLLREIEKLLGRPIPSEVVPGFEPDRSIRPERIQRGGGQRGPAPRIGSPRGVAHGRPGPSRSGPSRPAQPVGADGRDPGPRRPADGRRPADRRRGPVGIGSRPVGIGSRPAGPHRGGQSMARPSGPRPAGPRPHGPRPGGPQPSRQPGWSDRPRIDVLPGEQLARARRPD